MNTREMEIRNTISRHLIIYLFRLLTSHMTKAETSTFVRELMRDWGRKVKESMAIYKKQSLDELTESDTCKDSQDVMEILFDAHAVDVNLVELDFIEDTLKQITENVVMKK